MSQRSRWVWGAWGVFLVAACGTATSRNQTPHAGQHPHASGHAQSPPASFPSASDPIQGQLTKTGGSSHHFEPRPAVAHYYPTASAAPLSQLPPFVDGSAQCFRHYQEYSGYPIQQLRGQGLGGSGRSMASSGSAAPPRPAPAPSPSLRPSSKPKARVPARSPTNAGSSASDSSASEGYGYTFNAAPLDGSAGPQPKAEKKGDADMAPQGAPTVDSLPQRRHADGYGAAIYLSNDDTMSLSSAQRLIYAIERFAPLPAEHIRPHELLNYFSFQTAPVPPTQDFAVAPSIYPHPEKEGVFTLGLAISGRPLSVATRRNANLSFVLDRSGSMSAEGRMDYVKRGLLRSLSQLKRGDIVSITLFDTDVCQLAQNFVVGRDSESQLQSLISRITPMGSTNLHDGLQKGYQVANQAYQQSYTNRVVMVTDALTNTGITDSSLISMVGKHYDQRRIRLSGVGVGRDFNDDVLDQLTERGKGAYVFLGSDAEVDAVFGERFVSLIETIANDVHFQLHLPPSLAMETFYGEEASTVKERVQPIHYFAGTSQMFLSDLRGRGSFPRSDDIMLTIEYEDPETGSPRLEEYSWNLGQVFADTANLKKARMIDHFARSLGSMASRGMPARMGHHEGAWEDQSAANECQLVRSQLQSYGAGLSSDPEVSKVYALWDTYCRRYASYPRPLPTPTPTHPPVHGPPQPPQVHPGPPSRNNDYAPPDQWPSASR